MERQPDSAELDGSHGPSEETSVGGRHSKGVARPKTAGSSRVARSRRNGNGVAENAHVEDGDESDPGATVTSGSEAADHTLNHANSPGAEDQEILVEDLAAEGAYDIETGAADEEPNGEPHWETQLFETATVADGVREIGGGSVRMVTVGVFALACAVALVLYFANSASQDVARNSVERTAPLPDLIGKDESSASKSLGDIGVKLEVERRPHAVIKSGQVTEQDPEAGARVARGETVELIVSSGPAERLVPDGLIGADRPSSVRFVSELGIDTDVVKMYSTKTPAGLVAATVPKEGEPLLKNQKLEIQLSIGPAPVKVPNVVDRKYGQGADMLKRAGFKPQKVLLPHPSVPPGTIFSLSRTPGNSAPDGSTVQVFVSRGPAKNVQVDPKLAPIAPRTYLVGPTVPPPPVDPNATTVPPTDPSAPPATTNPTTPVTPVPPATQPPATPAPTPTPTTPPPPASTTPPVPAMVAVPNVVGAIDGIARAGLEAMGLQVVVQNTPNGNIAVNHQVVAQTPAAGAQVPAGTTVTLTVSIFQLGA